MTPWQHIIWDWNGTLFDDAWLCVEVMNGCLQRRGLPAVDADRYKRLFGFPVRNYYLALGFDLEAEPFELSGTEFIAEYDRRRHECGLQHGVLPALQRVAAAGVPQSLLSAYRQGSLEEMVAHFGLRRYFTHLVGLGDHYAHGKSDNGVRLAGELGCCPQDVLLVGDTAHDAEVAAAMGVACHLIDAGHASRDRLEACGVPVFDNLEAWRSTTFG